MLTHCTALTPGRLLLSYSGILLNEQCRSSWNGIPHSEPCSLRPKMGSQGSASCSHGVPRRLMDATALTDSEVAAAVTREFHRAFDVEQSVIRIPVFRQKDGDIILFVFHHLVVDGTSMPLCFEDEGDVFGRDRRTLTGITFCSGGLSGVRRMGVSAPRRFRLRAFVGLLEKRA